MNISNYKRISILGGIALIILLSLGFYLTNQVSHSGKQALLVDIFPENAEITIDGRKINRGTVYLEPGVYEISASLEGFNSYSDTLKVGPHIKKYIMTLTPNTKEAEKVYEDNKKAYARVRKLSERQKEESGEYFYKKNPIARDLPYKTLYYSIGYRLDQSDLSNTSIIIEIDAPEGYRQAALYRLQRMGYDPTDLNINFRGYENPFAL